MTAENEVNAKRQGGTPRAAGRLAAVQPMPCDPDYNASQREAVYPCVLSWLSKFTKA